MAKRVSLKEERGSIVCSKAARLMVARVIRCAPFLAGVMGAVCTSVGASEYRDLGYAYLSPLPAAEYVPPGTQFLLVRFEELSPSAVTNLTTTFITVRAELTGLHSGEARVASDGRTIVFGMQDGFVREELVTVTLSPQVEAGVEGIGSFTYQFMIDAPMPGAAPAPIEVTADSAQPVLSPGVGERSGSVSARSGLERTALRPMGGTGSARIMSNGVSVPSDFPAVDISVNDAPSTDYLFLDYHTPALDYAMILNNDGAPVWYRRGQRAQDFKVQKNGMLTYFGGPEFTEHDEYQFIGTDQDFGPPRSFKAVNGYATDGHELQVLEDGTVLLFGIRIHYVDMGRYVVGGQSRVLVYATTLQEFTPEGDLVFQWRSWDHYDIGLLQFWAFQDSVLGSRIRFAHLNAVDVDTDGQYLISSKHQGEVTKVNRETGEVIWRLGGGHPTDPTLDPYHAERLQILDDPLGGFNVQHDIRVVDTNRYTLFDNHYLDRTANSRAVEYEVDPQARTAALVWAYAEDPPYGSYYMGNAQRLSNGNTLINWVLADAPKATEVRPDGTKVFELNWAKEDSESYRVMRFPWYGKVAAPNLIAEGHMDNVTLLFNKFGDPDVDHYRIYGGTSPGPTTIVATSETTLLPLVNVVNGQSNYFRVTAVSHSGNESEPSEEVGLMVNIVKPGENMVLNGDFSQSHDWWSWTALPTTSAEWTIEEGVSHVALVSGGNYPSDVNLSQPGMKLIEGRDYVLEYDAWAHEPRLLEVNVYQGRATGLNYSRLQARTVSPVRTHYRETFTVNDPTDLTARLVVAIGASVVDVYLDNVSLALVGPLVGDLNDDGCVDNLDLAILAGEWMQAGVGLRADLNGDGRVDFLDYDLMGQNWSQGPNCGR